MTLSTRLTDQTIGAVASNNIVSIRKDRDLFDSLKRLKNISDELLSDKLSLTQQEAILANRALVLCLMNKSEECREQVAELKKRFPESKAVSEIVVLLATKDQSPAVAVELLQGDVSVGGRLGLAHVYLSQGQTAKAAKCINSIEELAYTPGTVATVVSLYEAAGDSAAAQATLDRAIAHHKALDYASDHAMKIREGDCAHKIQKKQYQAAAEAYLDLLEGENAAALDPELRLRSLASLVVALYVHCLFADVALRALGCCC